VNKQALDEIGGRALEAARKHLREAEKLGICRGTNFRLRRSVSLPSVSLPDT
jgi:hypothetical protein